MHPVSLPGVTGRDAGRNIVTGQGRAPSRGASVNGHRAGKLGAFLALLTYLWVSVRAGVGRTPLPA